MRRLDASPCWDAVAERTFVRQVVHLETVDSTNDEARRRLTGGAAPPFLVVSDRQSRGRGRRENRWWTGKGSLAMTLCVGTDFLGPLARNASFLSLATALSVAEAASGVLLHREATVHWPNDVYVGERKLAGILIESTGDAYLIGIGVNTNNEAAAAPPDLASHVTTLRDLLSGPVDTTSVARDILGRFRDNLRHGADSVGLLMAEVNRRCGQKGRNMVVRRGEETIVGTFTEISLDGDLILETQEGRRAVGFGTVISFR